MNRTSVEKKSFWNGFIVSFFEIAFILLVVYSWG